MPINDDWLTVEIDGHTATARYYQDWMKVELDVPGTAPGLPCLTLRILHAKLAFTEDGSRQIGLAIHKIKCEPLT